MLDAAFGRQERGLSDPRDLKALFERGIERARQREFQTS
jgi:hypothetical protein